MKKDAIYWARWLFVPCALWALLLLLPCCLSFITNYFLMSSDFIFWGTANFWMACLNGMLCGLAWIVIVVRIVPTHKFKTALISCIPGAWLAWHLIDKEFFSYGTIYYSENHPFSSYAPTCIAWWGAGVGLLLMWRFSKSRRCLEQQRTQLHKRGRILLLALAILLFCGLVLPSMFMLWKYTLYHSVMHLIATDQEQKAMHKVEKLEESSFYNMDWSPGRILAYIPFGYRLDGAIFGCPTCRGVGSLPLHSAVARGHKSLVAQILELRGPTEYDGSRGRSLLLSAISSHDLAMVDMLIDKGVGVTTTNIFSDSFMLRFAITSRASPEVMERLIEAGANVNLVSGSRRLTPLDCANIWEPEAIPFLVSHGATNSAVQIKLISLSPDDSFFRFEGTDFVIQLPGVISPVNREITPSDHKKWKLYTLSRSDLNFSVGKEVTAKWAETNFNGFAAITEYRNYHWGDDRRSLCGRIAFDSSGYTHEVLRKKGQKPYYDVLIDYTARNNGDLAAIIQAIESIKKVKQ